MRDVIELRRKQINDYMSLLEFDESSISVSRIKSELQQILGEKPGIELKYKNDSMVVEGGQKIRKNGKLESITIFYTYEDMDGPHFDKISYFI